MKKHKKSTVHPSPPPPPPPPPPPTSISHHLALLPATILTLTVALSPEDKEILAYLLSKKTTTDHSHSPLFNCSCFRCYITYWVRWDSSPNRHLIHQIIDAFEDGLVRNNNKHKTKKDRRKNLRTPVINSNTRTDITCNCSNGSENGNEDEDSSNTAAAAESTRSPELSQPSVNEFEPGKEEGAVRKLVSFLGERIWGVWI